MRDPKLRAAAQSRRATLAANERALREHFLRILSEHGAFTRTARPETKTDGAPVK